MATLFPIKAVSVAASVVIIVFFVAGHCNCQLSLYIYILFAFLLFSTRPPHQIQWCRHHQQDKTPTESSTDEVLCPRLLLLLLYIYCNTMPTDHALLYDAAVKLSFTFKVVHNSITAALYPLSHSLIIVCLCFCWML